VGSAAAVLRRRKRRKSCRLNWNFKVENLTDEHPSAQIAKVRSLLRMHAFQVISGKNKNRHLLFCRAKLENVFGP
jgi:hypothetical protein